MQRWYFIHIMKTAGTSFRTLLEAHPELRIYPTAQDLAQQEKGWYLGPRAVLGRSRKGHIDLSATQLLCGHYAAGFSEALAGEWRRVTFLRDPVQRSLSRIAHRHRHSGPARPLDLWHYLEDADFVDRHIRDYQTKVFALEPDANVNRACAIDADGFARACARLRAVDLVGLTEAFPASIRLFEALSGWRFPAPPHVNKSPPLTASPEVIAHIARLVPHDLELYALAREDFAARIASLR